MITDGPGGLKLRPNHSASFEHLARATSARRRCGMIEPTALRVLKPRLNHALLHDVID
jgi:hypothetical protein